MCFISEEIKRVTLSSMYDDEIGNAARGISPNIELKGRREERHQ